MAFQMGSIIIDPNIILGFIIALLILIVGYFVGVFVGHIVRKGVEKTSLEKWLEKTGRLDALGGMQPPRLVGSLAKWWVFSLALFLAADSIQLMTVSDFLKSVAAWIPQLLAGILIIIAGLIIADFAADNVYRAKKLRGIKIISPIVRVLIIIYFLTIALDVIGIRVDLAQDTLLIIVGGIVLALALAIGIGFGFGFRKHAEKIVGDVMRKI